MGIAVIHLFSSLHKPPIANLAMKDHGTMIQTCYSLVLWATGLTEGQNVVTAAFPIEMPSN